MARKPILLFLLAAAFGAPEPGVEQEVKAEFIHRFTDYIEWPSTAFPSDTSAFVVCFEGDGPLMRRLERILAGVRVKGHPARFRPLKDGEPAGCHILYIAPGARGRLPALLRACARAPVLTVGDSPGFLDHGVLINLFVEGPHVRFAINADAAEARGLTVSSRLRVLARKESPSR